MTSAVGMDDAAVDMVAATVVAHCGRGGASNIGLGAHAHIRHQAAHRVPCPDDLFSVATNCWAIPLIRRLPGTFRTETLWAGPVAALQKATELRAELRQRLLLSSCYGVACKRPPSALGTSCIQQRDGSAGEAPSSSIALRASEGCCSEMKALELVSSSAPAPDHCVAKPSARSAALQRRP